MSAFMLDDLDLNDAVNYVVEEFDPGEPDLKANRQTVTMRLTVLGGVERTVEAVKANEAAVWDKLRQAAMASGHDGVGTPVDLVWAPGTLSGSFPVQFGTIVPASEGVETLTFGYARRLTVTLTCLAGIRGEPVTVTTPGLLSAGGTTTYTLPATGGDLPSPVAMTLMDQSAGTASAVNRWRVVTYSHPELTSGLYQPIFDLTPAGSAVALSDALGGTIARITAGTAWQSIGYATRGTAALFTGGAADVLIRARDGAVLLDPPQSLSAESGDIEFVQEVSINFANNSLDTDGALRLTWAQDTTRGNLLVMAIKGSGGTASPTVMTPDRWTAGTSVIRSGEFQSVHWFYKENCDDAEPPVFFGTTSNDNNMKYTLTAFEISGIVTAGALDKQASATGNSTSGNGGATGTLSQAHELVLTAVGSGSRAVNFVNGWTAPMKGRQVINTAGFFNAIGYKIVNATTTTTPAFGFSAATQYAAATTTWKAEKIGGSLNPGRYQFRLTSKRGTAESLASNIVTVTLKEANAGVRLAWDAPVAGTPDDYRAYAQLNDGSWVYDDLGSTALTTDVTDISGWTAGDPPEITTKAGQWRLQIGRGSGTTLKAYGEALSNAGGTAAEWLVFPDVPLSGPADQDEDDPGDWYMAVEGKNASGTAPMDADLALVVPRRATAAVFEYRDLDLAVPRGWEYQGRQDGRRRVTILGDTVTLTASGNEITDVTRLANTQGDGLAYPDRSVGIWKAATNLITNGGFESNTTGWAGDTGAAVLSRDSTHAKFGSWAGKMVVGSATAFAGYRYATLSLANGTTYTVSFWIYGVAGDPLRVVLTDGTGNLVNTTETLSGGWQRFTYTGTAVATTSTGLLAIDNGTTGPVYTWWLDGVQVETGAVATPYIQTSGGTGSRSAARVRMPTTALDETQSWVAARVRLGWANTADPSSNPTLFQWKDDANNLIELRYDTGSDRWELQRRNGSGTGEVTVADTFSRGDKVTVVAAWTATALMLAVDSGTFTSTAAANIPTLSATTADIGSSAGSGDHINGDVLWLACGNGTLSTADAVTLNALGATKPSWGHFADAASIDVLWHALRSTVALDGGTEAGSGLVQGRPTVGPGPTTIAVIGDVQDGVATVDGVGALLRLTYWPLWSALPGEG